MKAFWSQFNENVLRHHIQEEGELRRTPAAWPAVTPTVPLARPAAGRRVAAHRELRGTPRASISANVVCAVYYFPWLATRIMLPPKVSAGERSLRQRCDPHALAMSAPMPAPCFGRSLRNRS